jgi:hypothetical protein
MMHLVLAKINLDPNFWVQSFEQGMVLLSDYLVHMNNQEFKRPRSGDVWALSEIGIFILNCSKIIAGKLIR